MTWSRRRRSLVDRFEEKVSPEPNTGCHLWTACVSLGGYGRIASGGRKQYETASRVAWRLYRGQIPEGLFVLHRCDVPSCVNPDHLFLGTAAENTADMVAKGRHRNGVSHPNTARGVRGGNAAFRLPDLAQVLWLVLARKRSYTEVARRVGVSRDNIGRIARGRTYALDLPAVRARAASLLASLDLELARRMP